MPEYVFDCIDNPDLTKLAGLIYGSTNLQFMKGKTYVPSEGTIELGTIELHGSMLYDGSLRIVSLSDILSGTLQIIEDIISSFTDQAHKEV